MSNKNTDNNPFIMNVTGIITGTANATQFPDVPAQSVSFSAKSGNIGSFLIGGSVTTCYYELDAGQSTDWISISNLNELYFRNASGTSDYLSYWIQR